MKDVLKMRVLFVFIGIVLQILTGVFTSYYLQGNTQSIIILGSSVLFIIYYILVLSLGE
jgi:hypothetical protein